MAFTSSEDGEGDNEMSKVDLHAFASPMLVDGEEVVAGVRVNWNGMIPPSRVPATPLVARSRAGPGRPDADPDVLVTFPSAKQMALVLTGGRLLAWSLGISGRPKQYLGDVPLSAIEQVEAGQVQFGSLIRISSQVRGSDRSRGACVVSEARTSASSSST